MLTQNCDVIFINNENNDPTFKIKINTGEIYGPMKIDNLVLFLKVEKYASGKITLREYKNIDLTIDFLKIGLNRASELFQRNSIEINKIRFLKSVKDNLRNSGLDID